MSMPYDTRKPFMVSQKCWPGVQEAAQRKDRLQEQLALKTTDLAAAINTLTELHQELAQKQRAVLAVSQELATLHKTHEATVKVGLTCSLAPVPPLFIPTPQPLTIPPAAAAAAFASSGGLIRLSPSFRLQHAWCTKHCITKHDYDVQEAQTGSTELQKQLARKDHDLASIKEELAHLQQELKHAVGGKHEAAQVISECVAATNSFHC